MTTGLRLVSTRHALLAGCCLAALVVVFATLGNSVQANGPDVTLLKDGFESGNTGAWGGSFQGSGG
jgi:hypothetical protein